MKRKNRRNLLALSLVLSAACVIGGIVGCSEEATGTLTPTDEVYDYAFDQPFAADDKIDANMKIDGKLDEAVWQSTNYYVHGQEGESFKLGTHFTDNGLYIAAVALDDDIVWNGAYMFGVNSGFQFTVVGIDKYNDKLNDNLESTASHPTEKMIFNVDSKNVRSHNGVPVAAKAVTTANSMTVEMFMSWEDLHFAGKQEQIRIEPWYISGTHTESYSPIIFPAGFNPGGAYYAMYLFDENGSVSWAGTQKNTTEMSLGNSPFGFGATDRWDLSKDNAQEEVRSAEATMAKSELIWLKDLSAENFSFETKVQFTDTTLWHREEKKAGIILADEDFNRRLFVSQGKEFRLGDSVAFTWINAGSAIYTAPGATDRTVYMRVVKYGSALYYFYRYSNVSDYEFMYVEEYRAYAGDALTVGLYASCNAIFSDWQFTSYDENPTALKTELNDYVYFVDADFAEWEGSVSLSSSAIAAGKSLTLTVAPALGYYLEKLEIDGVDVTDDFNMGAEEGIWSYDGLTGNATVKATFEQFNEADMEQMQLTWVYLKNSKGENITGASACIYPVTKTANGYTKNAVSNKYYYKSVSTPWGSAEFTVPYKDSTLYADGTYLVKIYSNGHFHYEQVITVIDAPYDETTDDDGLDNYKTTVVVPTDLIIQGDDDVEWSINDDEEIGLSSSKTGDHKSIAYFPESFTYGEISANFTLRNSNTMVGFGYRIADGNAAGLIGVIGVRCSGGNLEAVTYNYRGSYKQAYLPFDGVTTAQLKERGDIVDNGGGSVSFNLRLIKGGSGMFMFVGDTLVYTFRYNEEVTLNEGQNVHFGLMVRTISSLSSPAQFTIRELQRPTEYENLSATVKGTIINPTKGSLKVLLRGENAYGITTTQELSVLVKSNGDYSFTINDVASVAKDYTVEFYQGDSVLRTEDGAPIQLSVEAGSVVKKDITFNEFKKDYKASLYLEGIEKAIPADGKAIIGENVSLPETYEYDKTVYLLNKTATDSVIAGVIPAEGKLELVGYYEEALSFEKMASYSIGRDEKGATLTFPTKNGVEKYAFFAKKSNSFSLTATITGGVHIPNLDSGFVVSDGTNHITFLWKEWGRECLYARDRWHGAGIDTEFGGYMQRYNSTNNPSMRWKVVYYDMVFTFYKVDGDTETLLGAFDLNEFTKFNKGKWTKDTELSVGFFSWNDAKSGATFSDIRYEQVSEYLIESYTPNDEGGYDKSSTRGVAPVGSTVNIHMGNNLFVLDPDKENITEGVIVENQTIVLKAYYKHSFQYSSKQGVSIKDVDDQAVFELSGSGYKYLLSHEAGNKIEATTTITNRGSGAGLGFVVGQGENSLLFYWGDWETYGNWFFVRLNGKWVEGHPQIKTSGMPTIVKDQPLNVKMTYQNGVFTFFAEKDGTMNQYATYSVEQCNQADAKFDPNKGFFVGIGGCADAGSIGEFSNLRISVETVKKVSYTQTTFDPEGNLIKTETLTGDEGDTAYVNGAYVDADGRIYVYDDVVDAGEAVKGVLTSGTELNLSAKLNKEVFQHGVNTNNIDFMTSKEGNLVFDTTGNWYRYIYSSQRSTDFSVTAKFTSLTENCETGFSVMNEKGEKLTFRLVSWDNKLCVVRNYDYTSNKYWDIGGRFYAEGGKQVPSGASGNLFLYESITMTLTYQNGEFSITCNGKTNTFDNTAFTDFTGPLYVGFLTWNDALSGALVEIIDLTFNDVIETPKEVNYLFIGDSWIDRSYWKSFREDFGNASVFNLGYGGAEVPYWQNQISNLTRTVLPKNIVVHLGINDIINTNRTNEEILADLKELVVSLQQAYNGVNIYWISISPTNRGSGSAEWQDAKVVNGGMESYLAKESNCHYIDFADAFCQEVGESYATTNAGAAFAGHYIYDGLHLNEKGYVLFVKTIKQALSFETTTYVVNRYYANLNGEYGDPISETYAAGVGDHVAIDMPTGTYYIIDSTKPNLLQGEVLSGGKLVLSVYFKEVFAYSKRMNMSVNEAANGLTFTTENTAQAKEILSEQSATKFEVTATITNTSSDACGLGFVVGQGSQTFHFYWGSWETWGNWFFARLNGKWVEGHPQIKTTDMPTIVKDVPLNVKMIYDSGTFTFFAEKGGTMNEYATFTVDQCNAAGANFDAAKGFTVGVGGIADATSIGTFSNVRIHF